jgi:hypothetical protein
MDPIPDLSHIKICESARNQTCNLMVDPQIDEGVEFVIIIIGGAAVHEGLLFKSIFLPSSRMTFGHMFSAPAIVGFLDQN